MAKKKFFVQMHDCSPGVHRAKHFDDLSEARQWLRENGSGSIKKRGGVLHDPWLRHYYFDKRVWSVVEETAGV